MSVCAWRGCLWITQEGGGDDVILKAGEWFRIGRRGLTLIHALEGSAIALTSPQEEVSAKSIDVVRSGTQAPTRLYEPVPGWRSRTAALKTQLMKIRAEIRALLVQRAGAAL